MYTIELIHQHNFQSIAYLLPEGQVEWVTGIAAIDDDDLVFTWCTRSVSLSRYISKPRKSIPFSSHEGR